MDQYLCVYNARHSTLPPTSVLLNFILPSCFISTEHFTLLLQPNPANFTFLCLSGPINISNSAAIKQLNLFGRSVPCGLSGPLEWKRQLRALTQSASSGLRGTAAGHCAAPQHFISLTRLNFAEPYSTLLQKGSFFWKFLHSILLRQFVGIFFLLSTYCKD